MQPGGGKVKIENRKLEWNTQARTKAVNEKYVPGGGDVKVGIDQTSDRVYHLTFRLKIVN